MKKMVVLWVGLLCSLSFSQSYHADYKTVNMHSPFRWVVADSTARAALTVTARDTQKLCFQLSDTTIWCLIDNSPKNWAWVSGKKADSLKVRSLNADSATIPVELGVKTFRDSAYFAGGLRGLRLYTPQATIDSIIGLLKIGDSLYIGKPSGLSATSKKTITFRSGGFAEPAPYLQGSNGDKVVLYRDLASVYDGTIGVGSSGNLWIKSVGAAGAASVEVYVDSACAAPKFRVTKDSIKCNETVFADSGIKFNSGDLLSVYDTGSFPCTLKTTSVTEQQIVTAKYAIIGNSVTISIPTISGVSISNSLNLYCTLPTIINPTYKRDGWCRVVDNNTVVDGRWNINVSAGVKYIGFNLTTGLFTTSGYKGVGDYLSSGSEVTLHYIKN